MPKFAINEAFADRDDVDAKQYVLSGDFFKFYDQNDDLVLTYSASKVTSIRRIDEK